MSAEARPVSFADLRRAVELRDPELAELVVTYAGQPDPEPGEPEEAPAADVARETPDEDAWTMERARRALAPHVLARKNASERKAARREVWEALAASPFAPPRVLLGDLLLELYEAGDEPARSALQEILLRAPISFGLWRGAKRIYKRAEARHDAAIFGVLAYRFDSMPSSPDVTTATFVYLRRRAWRWLRQLGRAVPELYPLFAGQVLKHYPQGQDLSRTWIAAQIWAHRDLIGRGSATGIAGPPAELSRRAFDAAWKLSPEPLLRLLEDAQHETVASFAVRSLEKDHPEALRSADARWLARIAAKPLGVVHELLVRLLSDNPELAAAKLRALGLHDTVLALLGSPSASARKYAVEYVRAHAADMPIADLVFWARTGAQDVRAWAAARLAERSPRELGLPALVALLELRETSAMAAAKLKEAYSARDLDREVFVALALAGDAQRKLLAELYQTAKLRPPAPYWQAVLDDERADARAQRAAMRELEQYPGAELGQAWLAKALFDPRYSDWAWRLLQGGALSGPALDVEWVKGLVLRPRFRALALAMLGEPKIVAPAQVGLDWLLALARRGDEQLGVFAHRYLLAHFAPEDFGVERLWALATGPGEPELVRTFAADYLQLHHPELGPTRPEARALGITPRLSRDAYTLERVRAALFDERADVRRFGAAIARVELSRWGDRRVVYTFADSPFREARTVAAELMLGEGLIPADWLAAEPIFALAESLHKATRELALALIRRHYATLGGAARLAWLMESPDREVRLFAVRLLWEKHRPRAGQPLGANAELAGFLRATLLGLPPGRLERRDPVKGDALPARPLPASVAKRRLIEVVRDLAKDDVEFARLAVPVLAELARSVAKGEWHGCIAALAQIGAAHPELGVELGAARAGGAR